ncbi:uncharacterized protein LOC113523093 isoform X2 [Galleria mellonella]|uniref:Uncharacterized protein LOC113523093 isoform X2 n=1 Tax=Galleria mellonella TaxID=7137 RepID=A0ABM3MR30_GALME|nr:uncharacterized protein LOC113523093 isoform X2 [Galleria mellonella]
MFFSIILFIYFLTTLSASHKQFDLIQPNQKQTGEVILCRNCGNDVTASNFIISESSPESRYTFNDTLFNRDEVMVQMLLSDFFIHFPVITTTQSSCMPTGEWKDIDSWFPDYIWRPCLCPECGAYIGRVFKPSKSNKINSTEQFYGLILESLIGETYSIIQYPTILGN